MAMITRIICRMIDSLKDNAKDLRPFITGH